MAQAKDAENRDLGGGTGQVVFGQGGLYRPNDLLPTMILMKDIVTRPIIKELPAPCILLHSAMEQLEYS